MDMREDKQLLDLRPEVFTEQTTVSEIETFQNEVLRPILKLQHDLFVIELETNSLILQLLQKHKSFEAKQTALKQFLLHNRELKHQFIGQVTGMLTNIEYLQYKTHKKEIDKRIFAMTVERILSI
jgi:hypothetical protein